MDGKLIWLLCFIFLTKNYTFAGNGNEVLVADDQIIDSVQLGIQHVMKNAGDKPECDVVMPDFLSEDTIVFPQNGAGQTPNHRFPEFTFISYAPIIFLDFRNLYKIKHNEYEESFGSSPLREFPNPGLSGSIFYVTHDDKFIMKTLTKEESEYLRKLLPGYHLNLKQNPSTLLPKFFGLYRYQRNSIISTSFTSKKDTTIIDLVGMNNLIPSRIKIHRQYDLNGITFGKTASKNENNVQDPDFEVDFPDGIFLNQDTYEKLVGILERDCTVLKSSKIINYSLLMGVHYVDREEEEKGALTTRRIARKSIKYMDSVALPLSGLHALSGSGERLLLFFGIIDVLQCFDFEKNPEHMLKATIDDSDYQEPDFYASRFFNFLTKTVFKIGMFPLNPWLSAFKYDSPDMRTDRLDSFHIGEDITNAKRDDFLTKIRKRNGKLRMGKDGVTNYENISADQIMGSVQLSIHHVVKSLYSITERDLLVSDITVVEETVLPRSDGDNAPHYHFPKFTFKWYAPFVFNGFRTLYDIQPDDYHRSLCSSPLREISNPANSGSLFYITQDDKFLMKSVREKENKLLLKLLSGYCWNFDQNPDTLLPKFFGYYVYEYNSNNIWTDIISMKTKNFKLIVMNNLLPSKEVLHEKYDLKGTTREKKASESEKKKDRPTYRDVDFKEMHPDGFFLEPDVYTKLFETLANDCRVLKSFEIMDYSLLMGVHYLNRDKTKKTLQMLLQSPNIDVNEVNHSSTIKGIRAWEMKNGNKEDILLFVGIIDVLQTYSWEKQFEYKYKSFVYKEDDSVIRPDLYATRFLNFLFKSVFKKLAAPPVNSLSTSEGSKSCRFDHWENQKWLQNDELPWV